MELRTERLLLRDIREGDEATIAAFFAEPAAQNQVLASQRTSGHWHEFVKGSLLVQEQPEREHFAFIVTIAVSGQTIGICTLTNAWRRSPSASIGWHLGAAYAGLGYATELATELLVLSFNHQEIQSVRADCFADNGAQLKVLTKLGMRPHWAAPLLRRFLPITYGESRPITRLVIRRKQWLEQVAAGSGQPTRE